MSRFDPMTKQDWAIRDAINDILQKNNRPTSDYTYSAIPDEALAPSVVQPVEEVQTVNPGGSETPTSVPYIDYFALLNPVETPASALESKLSQMQSVPDLSVEPAQAGKWWAGDMPTYPEYVAQLYRMQDSLTPEQFDAYAAQIDAMKADPASGFYQNPYTGITSPYVDAIAKLGIDVSGGINDEWIAQNQYLLQGARYTDAGTTPAAPTKTSTAAQNAAYYYYQIQRNYNDTKEVLNEEAALKDEIAYWVGRDDLNLSDDQILERLDWGKKYKYLQGLKTAQSDGHVYNYTQPIDYNPDNLRGYIWAARNNGGSGNAEMDAVNAALGRGNVWKENKEISDKLDFRSDAYSPYSVKSTLDDAAQYFGVKEFEPGWAEKAAKTKIDWNNPDDVKYWQQVYNAESFTEQAETEVKEIYDRIDTMIAAGITDPAVIEDGLWDKGLDGSAALTALKKLDASMVRPDKLEGTTRPIDYRRQDVQDYIKQKCAKAAEKESLPEFGTQMNQVMNADSSPSPTQMPTPAPRETPRPVPEPTPTPTPMFGQTASTAEPSQMPTPAPRETPRPVPEPTPTPAPMFGQSDVAQASVPAQMPTPAPRETPRPVPVEDQTAKAVNAAQSKAILDSAKTILATGTPDEKMLLNLAPTANAERVAADMAGSVQNGTADAGTLYETTAKQARNFTAAHYMAAKMAIQQHDEAEIRLTELQAQRQEIEREYDQIMQQLEEGISGPYDILSSERAAHDSVVGDYFKNQQEAQALLDQMAKIDTEINKTQSTLNNMQRRYDQAQGDLKTSESMINAAAMQSVWKANPDMDSSTPGWQKALAEALDEQSKLTKSIDLLMDVSGTYKPTEWAPTTVLDNMLNNGFDAKTTALAANGIIREADKELAALDQAEATVQEAGVAIPGDSNNIKRAREQAQQKKQEAEDFKLRMNEDFDQVVADAKKEILANGKPGLALYAADPSLDQAEVTLADNLSMLAQAGNVNIRDAVQPHTQSYMGELTQEERDTYLYKLAKEGEQAAWDYYNGLADAVNVRRTMAQNEEMAAFAKDMPVLAAVTSIGISPDTIKSAGYVAASLISGQEINPYSRFFNTTWATKTLDQNAKEKILEPLEEGSFVKKIAGIGYDAATSGAKSLLNSALTAPFAGGSAFLSAVPMGIQAAGSAAQEAKLQGGSDTQAALMAGVTFAAETLSETITTQNIAQAIDSGAKGVKGAMKKVLSNDLAEEFFGESANQFVESIADTAIMDELSQREQKIKEYEQTMNHEEAVKQADKDFWTDVLAAGVTGALSAAGTSGISYAAGRLNAAPNTTQPSIEGQVRANALANGLPLDRTTQDMTNRTLTLLTSSLNAGKGSQVQALSAALFPVTGDAQGQRAAVSAGLHLANQMGTEQAVAVAQDVIMAAENEGADQQAVKDALRIAALGQGEASAVLNRISQNGVEFGDVQALIDAANRDAEKPAIADRMQAIIHNDRVASRARDLIGEGALNSVKPYEQAYSQAKAQEAQSQQALETEQERAQTMGENLKTVQGQHAADPANQALAGAMKQATKDMVGQVKVVGEYQQGLETQQQKTRDAEKDLNRVREEAMTKVREQALADVQAEEQAEAQAVEEAKAAAEAAALAEAEAQAQEAQSSASSPNAGTVYTNDQVPVSYHWALVPASDLVTSNTDTGEANSAYPAELQPRDRTRAASQDQVAGMVRNLNPARLGESADAQNGAPIVGPDNVVESGNARTMAIRQAMASNPESAARYTQYVRDNAARFGLNPDDVTDNSVLVRVRDTDLDRVAFARAANESTTAGYSPSENAQGDADRLTPRMMELFAPSDTGRLDTTDNHAFALAFLNEIIPESERGAYMQDDGSISQQGYDRIRNAVFQRAYGSTALTQALTEDTDGSARNVMNALLKAAPRMMALQDAVDQGGVYDTGLAQKVAEAAQRYMQLKNAGMSVEAYLEQTAMPGIQTEDEATQSFMRLFEEYRRSGKKLSEALTNIADAVEDAGDPRAVSFLGQNEAPPLTELIRQGVERMEAARRGFAMDAKTNNVPTLTGKVPESDGTNAQTQNLPERETYTMGMPSAVPPTGNGTTPAAEMPPVNGPQRQFGSQTAQNSDLLHEEVKQYLRENSSYDPDSNNEQLDRAAGWVQEHATEQDPEGYYGAVAEVQGQDFNAYSADGQARMLTLMSMAALKGDVATETALADAYNQQGTVLGRALQARQIFDMMTPLGRQSVLIKETNKINQRYAEKGQTTRVALSPDTLDKAGKAKTAEDFQRVQKQAYKELAEQMPPTWKDKLQAWRMLSMLGNPRTHVRNVLGNAIFMPAVKLKNVIGTALESVFVKPGSGEMRTKSLTVSKENRAFAKADAVKMKDTLTGEAKYNADQKVDQERKVWGTKDNFFSRTFGKALQRVSDFNSWALEAEDWMFLRRHYENALGGWMQANKLTPDTIKSDQLTQAREYAINEAQKATYRDASKVASWLSKSSREGGGIGWIIESVLPFKKTPANILKRGIEYSPVGLMRAVTQDLANVKKYNDWVNNGSKGAMPKNALSPTHYIDRLSSGLSGTAITALGYMLASMGAVTVGLDDDKGELEELAGKQEYALNIRLGDIDVSYTVDWAAPVSLPFFVGASLFNATQGEIQNVEQVADALLSITEPVFNLSMLDGVNSLLNVSQWSSGNAMTQIGEKLVTNYLSSYIPTALGQVSRTIDPVRRKSYVESGAPMSTFRYAFEQAQNKTPFSVSNIPYRNVWGEEDRSPEWLAAIENLISPGYISEIKPGKLEQELASLYDETGDKKAVPQAASKSPYINGQQVKLNAEQYDQYTRVRGTTAKNLLEELINRPEWALLDGNAKIDIVGEAWTYSNAVAAKDLFPDAKITAWIQTAQHEGNAADVIMNRHEEKAKKEYVDGHKTSLFKAVDEHDTEAFNTSMFALMDADKKDKEAQGKKQNPAYVNNLLVNHYKPLYITAINSGDTETADTIRDNLLSLPITGIDTKTILGWQYEAQKQKAK